MSVCKLLSLFTSKFYMSALPPQKALAEDLFDHLHTMQPANGSLNLCRRLADTYRTLTNSPSSYISSHHMRPSSETCSILSPICARRAQR